MRMAPICTFTHLVHRSRRQEAHRCFASSSREAFPAARMSSAAAWRNCGHSRLPDWSLRRWHALCQKPGLSTSIPSSPAGRDHLCLHALSVSLSRSKICLAAEGMHEGAASPLHTISSSRWSSKRPCWIHSSRPCRVGRRAVRSSLITTAADARPATVIAIVAYDIAAPWPALPALGS